MIPVTKPYLPPKEEYLSYIDGIWSRNWLTNSGPLELEFEDKLRNYLNISNVSFVSNGTIALQMAIKALSLQGEIITTPFSFIATTSSIVWEGCTPVFADIDKETFNISPDSIERNITSKTSAILATHVYGNPCDIDAIEKIAKKHNIKVIYDGAHAFGVKYKGKSIFEYGDISITSFHATKLFHTIEGGAIFTTSDSMMKKLNHMKNFGHDGPEKYIELGVNGKNSEFHAAMGLTNFKHIEDILSKRKTQFEYYLKNLGSENYKSQKIASDIVYNYAYFPMLLNTEKDLLKVINALSKNEIFGRRYFFPTLDNATYLDESVNIPIAKDIANRILCLPLFHSLNVSDIDLITAIINDTLKS